jgi:hypothetical protein
MAARKSTWWLPTPSHLARREDDEGQHFILEMALSGECTTRYGGPRIVTLEIGLPRSQPALHFNLQWFQKPANRLPEAFWFSFCPRVRGVRFYNNVWGTNFPMWYEEDARFRFSMSYDAA